MPFLGRATFENLVGTQLTGSVKDGCGSGSQGHKTGPSAKGKSGVQCVNMRIRSKKDIGGVH